MISSMMFCKLNQEFLPPIATEPRPEATISDIPDEVFQLILGSFWRRDLLNMIACAPVLRRHALNCCSVPWWKYLEE